LGYRIEGAGRWKTTTFTPHEFIRRYAPASHRIRHYGLLANGTRALRTAAAAACAAMRAKPGCAAIAVVIPAAAAPASRAKRTAAG
jgi:hypothetical protein